MTYINGPTKITTNNLSLYLDASNNKSYGGTGNVWYDLSGNNNHSTIYGPTFKNDSYAKYMHFTGTNYVDCGMNTFDTTELTISCWINSFSTGTTIILGKGTTNPLIEWGLGFGYSTKLVARMRYYADQILYEYQPLLSKPHMVSMVAKNNSFLRVYIDSELVDEDTTVGAIQYSSSNPVYLGRWTNHNPGKNFYLYTASLYNRALESVEILQNYNALKSRFGL